jgi:hypothetical protein
MMGPLRATLIAAVCGLPLAIASPADAKGCIKGAVVDGLAGHMAGHGVLGAAGGCAVEHPSTRSAPAAIDALCIIPPDSLTLI